MAGNDLLALSSINTLLSPGPEAGGDRPLEFEVLPKTDVKYPLEVDPPELARSRSLSELRGEGDLYLPFTAGGGGGGG